MKTIRRTIALMLAIMLATLQPAFSALDLGFAREDGGRPGAFLDFAASARSLAMGSAHVAVADDASASYWNPAGLAQLEQKDIVALYSALHEDTRFGSMHYAQPTIDMGTFGLGLVFLDNGNLDKRNVAGSQVGSFTAGESAMILSHGIRLGDRWMFGSAFKGVRQEIDTYSDTSFGLDLGTMYQWSDRLQFGLAMKNFLAPSIKLRSVKEQYPLDIRTGAKYQLSDKLLVATDFNHTQGRNIKINLGGEYEFNETIAVRLGLNEKEVTAGLGVNLGQFSIDYAFGYHDAAAGVDDLGSSHRLGFHMPFGRRVADEEISLRWQKKGQIHLEALRNLMENNENVKAEDLAKHMSGARQVIKRQGYLKAQDLFEAQGYIHFFDKQYERCVLSLSEAAALVPGDEVIAMNLEFARLQMTEEQSRELVANEMRKAREYYAIGDWKSTVKTCEKVLTFEPENVEAMAFIEHAQARINEPIDREMKKAVSKFQNGEYLDAIKLFSRVKELDPENAQAAQYIAESISQLEKQAAMPVPTVGDAAQPGVEQDIEKSRELYSQGLVLYSEGKLLQASDIWAQSIQYDENNLLAKNAYSRVQIEINDNQ